MFQKTTGKYNRMIAHPFQHILFFKTGNALMQDQWKDLALYHYSSAPTLTSTCSVCGLRPAANKSLYVKTVFYFIFSLFEFF
jgi:hypothetical protein